MNRLLILAVLLLAHSLCTANDVPAGWNRYIDNKKNTVVFKPNDTTIDIMVKYYPIELLEGLSVDSWLRNKVSNSTAPRGEWVGEFKKPTRESFNRSFCLRSFRDRDGNIGQLVVSAFSADLLYVRVGMVIYGKNVSKPYRDQAFKIFRDLSDVEIANAKDELRGLNLETGAFKVTNVKKGGPIKPGRYVGKKTVSGEARATYSIMLYDTGEYEFLNTKKKYLGYYSYSEYFAKLYIEDPCTNTLDTSESHYCVYGTNTKTGKPIIYAYDSPAEYRLNWVGEVDRLSPSQREQLKEKKKAQRYQYTTNPGDGLSLDEIETILYVFEESNVPGNGAINEEIYLLTKNGRVMDNLPVAPNILDVSKSQNREPDRWGWWKFDGHRYSFSWDVDKAHYIVPKGKQKKSKPIPTKTRLEGEWLSSTIHSSSDLSRNLSWGERFDKEGRFVNFRRESIKVGGKELMQNKGTKQLQPGADEKGRYEFNGYSATLKYDNGDVWHIPTFTLDDRFQHIWYRGGVLNHR